MQCNQLTSHCGSHPVTGDVMPLAEAITQLSFLEFLQRCGVSIAPPQPSQLPVPISLLDAAVQTTPPCGASQDVSTQTSDQPVSSFIFLTWQCRRLPTVFTPHLWMLPCRRSHTVLRLSTSLHRWVLAQLPRFLSEIFVQTPTRSVVLHDVAIQLPITEFFAGCIFSNDPLDCQNFVRQSPSSVQGSRALLQPPPGLEQLAPPSGPAIGSHLHTTHGASTTAAPLRAWLRSAISVTPPQTSACATHVGSHHLRSATTGKRSASTALVGTHNLAITDSRTGSVPFPKPRALVLPLVHSGQSKPDGHTGLDTVDSDLMHHQFRLSLLQWNPGPARKYPSNIVTAVCGKFHAVIQQEASDHVPHL